MLPLNLSAYTGVLVGTPEAVSGGVFGAGDGPIFLDKLRCKSEQNLLECESGEPLGLATCSHMDDVGVRCPGI